MMKPMLASEDDAAASRRDDRMLAPTLWTARAIVPILVAAFVILYLFPAHTTRLWGWTVQPTMSAMFMGGGYLAGAYFFTRVATVGQWHRVAPGFLGTTVFASVLLVTTVLHWDRFNHDHVSFWAWLILYGTTPFLLPVLWWKNQRTDPGAGARAAHGAGGGARAAHGAGGRVRSDDVRIPRALRLAVGIGGVFQVGVALVIFLWPHLVVGDHWPWGLNTATARSLSAFIAFPAVTWLWFLFEDRWTSFRITEQTAMLGLALVALGALRARAEFGGGWKTPAYAVALAMTLGLNLALYLVMERRCRRPCVPGP